MVESVYRESPAFENGIVTEGRRRSAARTAGILLLLGFWAGCGLFSSRTSERFAAPSVVHMENGYLLELPAGDRQPQVEALVTQQRWVILTIVDPAYDAAYLERFSSPHIDSVEVAHFASAVQLSFRFRTDVLQATVVSSPSDPSILVSVFTR